jgi:hypothetical protein
LPLSIAGVAPGKRSFDLCCLFDGFLVARIASDLRLVLVERCAQLPLRSKEIAQLIVKAQTMGLDLYRLPYGALSFIRAM